MRVISICLAAVSLLFASCENSELNEGEEFRPRELHDNFQDSHFTRVRVDGVEYLMLERDNNNPHEGFGFMALRGNTIIEKQDTTLAMLRTIGDFQIQILASLKKESEEKVKGDFLKIYQGYLSQENPELLRLEGDSLIGNH